MALMVSDFSCSACGSIEEHIVERGVETLPCQCGNEAHRIITFGRTVFREEAPWIRTVLEVVAKDTSLPETQRFLAEPTRSNYHRWMKENHLRPLDDGEKVDRFELDVPKHAEEIMKMRYERRKIEI